MKLYFRNRFYFRGASMLGFVNTLLAFLVNRVLVRHMDDNGKTMRWSIGRGTDFPPTV